MKFLSFWDHVETEISKIIKNSLVFFSFLSENLKNTGRGVHGEGGGPAQAAVNFAGQFDLDIYRPGQVLAAPNHLHPRSEEVVPNSWEQFCYPKEGGTK